MIKELTASLWYFTCHFLHIVNPLILHCFKVLMRSLVARISQKNTSSRYHLINGPINCQPNNCYTILGSRSEKQFGSVTHDTEQSRHKRKQI